MRSARAGAESEDAWARRFREDYPEVAQDIERQIREQYGWAGYPTKPKLRDSGAFVLGTIVGVILGAGGVLMHLGAWKLLARLAS